MTYEAPSGWMREKKRSGPDLTVTFAKPPYELRIRRLGGKGSRHETAAAFLKSFEAKSERGRPAEAAGEALVSGSKVKLWRRSWRRGEGGLATEEFAVLPAGAVFYVLSWSAEGAPPDSEKDPGRLAWKTLLSSFKI